MTSTLAVGRILAPWGIRGDVVIQVLSDNSDRFKPGASVVLEGQPRKVERQRTVSGKTVVKLSGVNDRNAAEALRGKPLEVPEAELMALPTDTYFQHQIIGMTAVTSDGRELGTVQEILRTGSNDVYVVKGTREYLIPAIGDVVKQIDLDARQMLIDPIPGLLD